MEAPIQPENRTWYPAPIKFSTWPGDPKYQEIHTATSWMIRNGTSLAKQ